MHALQPCCAGMDLGPLKEDFGDKILLNGGIDSHHVLIEGTPETVREKTRETLEIMMPGGGYVAGASHDTILEETPVENVLAMFDAVREFGDLRPARLISKGLGFFQKFSENHASRSQPLRTAADRSTRSV